MISPKLTSTMSEVDQLTVLSRRGIERVGRRRSLFRALVTLVILLAILLPVALVHFGVLTTVAPIPPTLTAGVVLIISAALIPFALQLGWRCVEISTLGSSRGYRVAARWLFWLLLVAALARIVEMVVDWREHVYPAHGERYRFDDVLFVVSIVLGGISLLGLTVVAMLASRRQSGRDRPVVHRQDPPTEPEPPEGTVICCSGGGIRSAAFCLGGLQKLQEAGRYATARAVVGVSGGGYIAAALHVLRWRSEEVADGRRPWAAPEPPPFSPASPEFRWLRRHTRFLFDSARLATLAGLTIVCGIAVNLFWLALVLGGLAAWLGWLFNASGAVRDWTANDAVAGDFGPGWEWLSWSWLVLVAGLALFVAERVVNRIRFKPLGVREGIRTLSVITVWVGAAVAVLTIGLPRLMVAIHNYGADNSTSLAKLAYALGLVPQSACSPEGCGVTASNAVAVLNTPWASLVATVAAILAVVRAAAARLPADAATSEKRSSRLLDSLVHVVLPWLALIIVALAAGALILRWVGVFLTRPEQPADWTLVLLFGLAAAGVRLLTDANYTSLHHFYRERISYAFIQQRYNGSSRPLPYEDLLQFSKSKPDDGGPELVACAVANVSDVEYVAADRGCMPFVFDWDQIGLTDRALPVRLDATTYEFAADYQFREATVAGALAMSGAAFSPLVGREQRRVAPYRLVMALANARLGVWLPNPLWIDEARTVRRMIKLRKAEARPARAELDPADGAWLDEELSAADQAWLADPGATAEASLVVRLAERGRALLDRPGPYRLLKEGIGKTSVTDRRLYITDGGHYDNLGLVEALRRRPKTIIVLDASNDSANSFRALGEAVATARMDLDCEIEIDPTPMSTTDGVAKIAWVDGRLTYADGETATIHFAKAIKLEGAGLDTKVYAGRHPEFPRTGTGDQFYGEFDFEAYRQLGWVAASGLLAGLPPLAAPTVDDGRVEPQPSGPATIASRPFAVG